ncbi:MAG: antibiotic biosynthesis monooxygenase [Phaeodactylibacter sp.]|nr:antibiotic biosynthesis monooxygenase [Phaeodactylibacter sp.]
MIKRIVKLTFQEDKVADFLALYEAASPRIRAFPGCRHLELLQCTQPGSKVFFTFSTWDSQEHLDHYRFSEFFKDTWSRTKALFAEKAEAWSVMEWMVD